jgi:hypothetical protein
MRLKINNAKAMKIKERNKGRYGKREKERRNKTKEEKKKEKKGKRM